MGLIVPLGLAGLPGSTGPTGATGPVGLTGPSGTTTGATGATGVPGANGPAGAPGATGSAGSAGSNGATGSPGPAGASGPVGPTGPTGATGASGPSGVNGTVTGATGETGEVGQTGPLRPGDTGYPGVAGEPFWYNDPPYNYFTNPGFRYVQLFDPTIANAATDNGVTADAWKTPFENAGLEFQRLSNSGTLDWLSAFRLRLTKKTNAGKIMIYQALENMLTRELAGKEFMLRMGFKSSINRDLVIFVFRYDGAADTIPDPVAAWNGAGVDPTLNANFTLVVKQGFSVSTGFLEFTFIPAGTRFPDDTNNLVIGIYSDTQFAVNAYLEIGAASLFINYPFYPYYPTMMPGWVPLTPEEDLERVERFIEKSYNPDTLAGTPTTAGAVISTVYATVPRQFACQPIRYRRGKPKLPTIALEYNGVANAWWQPGPAASVVVAAIDPGINGFTVDIGPSPVGALETYGHYLVNASL